MRELSVFVDESGDIGSESRYYCWRSSFTTKRMISVGL